MELSFRDMQLNRILCYIDFTEPEKETSRSLRVEDHENEIFYYIIFILRVLQMTFILRVSWMIFYKIWWNGFPNLKSESLEAGDIPNSLA